MDFHEILMKGDFKTDNIKSKNGVDSIEIDDSTGKITLKAGIKITGLGNPGGINEYVLTSNDVNGNCSFTYRSISPSGIVLFESDIAVTGYILLTNIDDALVYLTKGSAVGSEAGGTDKLGGTWTMPYDHSHTISTQSVHNHSTAGISLTISQMPSHNHLFCAGYVGSGDYIQVTRSDGENRDYTLEGCYYAYTPNMGIAQWRGSGSTHNHGNVQSNGSHNHGGSTTSIIDSSFGSSWRPTGRNFTRQQKT